MFKDNPHIQKGICAADFIFPLCAALYAWLAFRGITLISANGALLDSDLQTYAQGMAGVLNPEQFANDPVLAQATEANSIRNLQRWLAEILVENGNMGLALLKAGAFAIFAFYCCWYALGRYLFRAPSMSALLALCSGITIWVGWGTFWGVTHSDPVPRVFFAAIFPLLLWLAILGSQKSWLRPLAMFGCGLAMWVHGVSALNCGAMFFCAFAFIRAPGQGKTSHLFNLFLCAAFFLGPALAFLWPSLTQKSGFTASDLAMFQQMQDLRWQTDFSNFWQRIANFFSPSKPPFFICLCGLASWFVLFGNKRQPFFSLWKMMPAFVLALFAVAIFCWLESAYSPNFGRLPMGHELVRGLRFLMPLSWLLMIYAATLWTGKWQRRGLLALALLALAIFNQDRQHLAVETALAQICGLQMPEKAASATRQAEKLRNLMQATQKIVPENEAIFCPEDQMPLRYLALRPLAHSFKDGYVFFYNKDLAKSANWLEMEKLLHSSADGFIKAWHLSGAPWLLIHEGAARHLLNEKPALKQDGWLLYHKPQ